MIALTLLDVGQCVEAGEQIYRAALYHPGMGSEIAVSRVAQTGY